MVGRIIGKEMMKYRLMPISGIVAGSAIVGLAAPILVNYEYGMDFLPVAYAFGAQLSICSACYLSFDWDKGKDCSKLEKEVK